MKKRKFNFRKPMKKWKGLSKKKKIITSAIAVVLVVAIVSGSVIVHQKNRGNAMPQMTASEATVTTGSISNTIVGTGNLEIDASDSIKIPSGITIKEVKVESGDSVSKGDILAVVDKTSVLEAMETVQEEMEALDEEIEDNKDVEETSSITTKVAGTIKKIYAKEGDSVTDCIAENGALIVIAVDGNADETIEVMASSGTISEIKVSKNEEVSKGDTLLTIENDEESTEYQKLIAERKELAESFKTLTAMAKNGTITADMDGTVGAVNISEGSDSSATGTSGSTSGSGVSASQMSYKADSTGTTSSVSAKNTTVKQSGVSLVTLTASSGEAATVSENETTDENEKISFAIISSGSTTKSSLVLETPKTGEKPQSEIKVSDNSYSGTIQWSQSVNTFAAGTTYGADITLTAGEGYIFAADSITKVTTGLLSGISISNEGKTLSFHITFPSTEEESTATAQSKQQQETISQQNGSQSSETNADSKNSVSKSSTATMASSASTGTASSGNGNVSTTSTNASSSDTATDSDDSSYSNQVTAFTLASNDTMILSVSVDELDINSVAKDQEATITMDAIEDTSFTGTVTKVSSSASSSGNGVAKYTVQITVPKDEQMKSGMNASATIVIENRENVLTIPVNAIQEKGSQSFVYTSKDAEGNLSGEVEVTTGLSDGDTVEITEGLSEGDTVYYIKTGNTSGSDSGFGGMFDKQSGGGMPEDMGSGNFGGRGGSGDGMPSGMSGGGKE